MATRQTATTTAPSAAELCADGLLSTRDAARFMGISRSAVYLLLSTHDLPSVRIGRRRLIPKRACVELAALALR
jgi:excisionase family DNA binding protein